MEPSPTPAPPPNPPPADGPPGAPLCAATLLRVALSLRAQLIEHLRQSCDERAGSTAEPGPAT